MAEVQYVTQKQNTYVWDPEEGEKNSGEIVTIPDDNYTVKQLLEKFVRNNLPKDLERVAIQNQVEPGFDDIDILSDPARDLVDAEEYIRSIDERVKRLKDKKLSIKKAAKAAGIKAAKAAEKKEGSGEKKGIPDITAKIKDEADGGSEVRTDTDAE